MGSDFTSFFKRELLRLELGTPQWILYAAAAFDSVVEHPQTLVGGGAQVHYTQKSRPTDVDMVGRITSRDMEALAAAGFQKKGRHWYYGWEHEGGVLVEIPSETSYGIDPPNIVVVSGYPLRVISRNDLMVDRLVQATDGTDPTWDEALDLAEGIKDQVDWELVRARCVEQRKTEMGLGGLPQVLDNVLDILGIAGGGPPVDYDRLFAKVGETVAASAEGLIRAAMFGPLARREYSPKDREVGLLLVWPDNNDGDDLWTMGTETARRVEELVGRPCVPWVYTETEFSKAGDDDPEILEELSEGHVDLPI